MAPHSSTLAWKIPWTEEPGRLQSMGSLAKGIFHAKMGSIKDRNGMDLTEAEDTKKRWQEYIQGIFPTQGSNLGLLLTGRFFITEPPGKPIRVSYNQFVFSGRKKSMWVPETGMG